MEEGMGVNLTIFFKTACGKGGELEYVPLLLGNGTFFGVGEGVNCSILCNLNPETTLAQYGKI